MKRDIVLMIVRDYNMDEIIEVTKEYLTITTEQVFFVIDYLMDFDFLKFEEGKLILTNEGRSALKRSNLNEFSLENANKYMYKVNEDSLKNYIPNNT